MKEKNPICSNKKQVVESINLQIEIKEHMNNMKIWNRDLVNLPEHRNL